MTRENQQTEVTALKKYPAGISGFEENTGGGKTLFATVCIFLVLFYTAKAYSELSIAGEGYDLTNHSLLFLGNETLPPMVYLENDKPVGIVVDLAEALKERMTRPVRFKYMHWTQAQQLVLEGKADALLQINPTEERKKKYDFSDSLLESEFSIFISFDREGVYDITDLRGLKVGVEGKGLPINILTRQIITPIIFQNVLYSHAWKKSTHESLAQRPSNKSGTRRFGLKRPEELTRKFPKSQEFMEQPPANGTKPTSATGERQFRLKSAAAHREAAAH